MKRQQSNPKRATKRSRTLLVGSSAILAIILIAVAYTSFASSGEGEEAVEQFMHLHGLAIAPWAPEEVYLSTHQGLIRLDSEGHWRYVSRVHHDFMGFQANPTEEGVLYSSGHPAPGSNLRNPLGFMVSRDRGETWEVIALAGQTDFHAMAVQPTDGKVIYGFSGGLWRSLDGGQTWEQRPSGRLNDLGGALSLSIHPEDADSVMAGTQRGLYRSEDGGATWAAVLEGPAVTAVFYDLSYSERVLAYAAHPDMGLMQSEDGGGNWEPYDFVVPGSDAVGYIAVHPNEPEVIYLGSYGQNLYKTDNGGATWQQLASSGIPHHD